MHLKKGEGIFQFGSKCPLSVFAYDIILQNLQNGNFFFIKLL
jgi:hypothetical protein